MYQKNRSFELLKATLSNKEVTKVYKYIDRIITLKLSRDKVRKKYMIFKLNIPSVEKYHRNFSLKQITERQINTADYLFTNKRK